MYCGYFLATIKYKYQNILLQKTINKMNRDIPLKNNIDILITLCMSERDKNPKIVDNA